MNHEIKLVLTKEEIAALRILIDESGWIPDSVYKHVLSASTKLLDATRRIKEKTP